MSEKEDISYLKFLGLEFPIYKQMWLKLSLLSLIIGGLVLFGSSYFFNYEITKADIPMGSVAAILFAYLLTLFLND